MKLMDVHPINGHSGSARLILAKHAVLRVEDAALHVAVRGGSFTLPATVHGVLQEFARPRTADEVFTGLEADFGIEDFRHLVGTLHAAGLLERADAQVSIETVLRPGLLAQPGLKARLRAATTSGRMCVIRDAFAPAFAEGVAGVLDATTDWKPYQDFNQPFFHYTHHNLYEHAQYDGELRRCFDIFNSSATKTTMGELFNVDCGGALHFGASLYLPGDYSLPHDDRLGPRSLAFVWHLSRNWDPSWGGHLYWAPTMTYLKPTFNTLIIFPVTRRSWHFVCPVSPYAKSQRLTVNGWWTLSDPNAQPGEDEPEMAEAPDGGDWLSSADAYETLSDDILVF
jgi:hypothetical protein